MTDVTRTTLNIKTELEVEFILPGTPNFLRLVGVNRAKSAAPAGAQPAENDTFLIDVCTLDDSTIRQYLDAFNKNFMDNVTKRRAELNSAPSGSIATITEASSPAVEVEPTAPVSATVQSIDSAKPKTAASLDFGNEAEVKKTGSPSNF